jgi:CubicO group peptidase (beta-lactamase class C family)
MPSNMNSPTYLDPFRDYDAAHLETLLAEQMDLNEKKYAYSNLGAGLLGFTLAKINGSTYDEMIQAMVARPLGLKSTGQFPGQLSFEYQVGGRGAYGKPTPDWQMDALAGCGVLYATAADLSRFILAHFDKKNKVLALTRKTALEVNDNYSVGLGWHILHEPDRNDWWWHNGAVGGFASSVAFDPKEKTGVVVLSNVSAYHEKMRLIDQLCFGFMGDQLKE